MTDGQLRIPGSLAVTINANTDDLDPTGIGSSTLLFLSGNGDYNITGIDAKAYATGGNTAGRPLWLINDTTNRTYTLPGLDGGSSADNQFGWSTSPTIGRGECIAVIRSTTLSKWVLFARGVLSSGGTTLPVDDSTAIVKGSSDATKQGRFEVDTNVGTGTTVALAFPSQNGVIATVAGSDTQVQFNDAGASGGDSGLTYDKTNDQLTATHARVGGVLNLTGDISATISSTQHDYAPTGFSTAGIVRLNPDTATVSITGFAAPSSPFNDGRELIVYNVGSGGFDINIINESASSTAANRFAISGNFTLKDNWGARFTYDSTSSRWRCHGMMGPVSHAHTSSVTGGTLDAAAIASGTMATARLGSGTADSTTVLHGDQAYGAVLNVETVASDVTNNDASANTLADVTGLSFSVTSGKTYWFKANIGYTAAATTTGSRWTVNGPSVTSLFYTNVYNNSATAVITSWSTTYQNPSGASAGSSTTLNVATVEGMVTPSANGTLAIQFASEVSSSAIVAKAGSFMLWREVS